MKQTLWDGFVNESYIIERIFVEELLERRLEALGLNEGTEVTVLNKKRSGAMIIRVRGTRLALGKQITTRIEVMKKEATENGAQ